jgi:hypothetical protein
MRNIETSRVEIRFLSHSTYESWSVYFCSPMADEWIGDMSTLTYALTMARSIAAANNCLVTDEGGDPL